MNTGTLISAFAHAGLLVWALVGGVFRSEPLPFEEFQVSVISGAEFAALTAPQDAPAPEVIAPVAVAPDVTEAPTPEATPEAPVETPPAPAAETPPPPDPPPAVPEAVPPEPVVEEAPPEPPAPPETVLAPPNPDMRPQPRAAPRVAPDPVAPPPPEADVADIAQDAVTDSGEAPSQQEEQEATAPEEATTEIVTEAEEPSGAPVASVRPRGRPERPQPATPPAQDAIADAVAGAVADAGAQEAAAAPAGPPLTEGEREVLRLAVANCWNVGALSSEALAVTVVVGFSMSPDGRPVSGSLQMLSADGGSGDAVTRAYEAARRAILRCGTRGYDLPADKYEQWKEIEITFNPERMGRL